MDILIISTVIFIVIAVLLYLITKSIGKAIGFTVGIFLIIELILGFMIYLDAMELKDNFPTEEKTFLLEHNNNYVAGFKITDTQELQNNAKFLTTLQIQSYQSQQSQDMLRNSYKLIILNSAIFQDISTIEFTDMEFTKDYLMDLLESNNPIEQLTNRFLEKAKAKQLEEYSEELWPQIEEQFEAQKEEFVENFKSQLNIKDDAQLKALIFILLTAQITQEDPMIVLTEYRNDNIIIYPETITFKFIKIIPNYLLDFVSEKINNVK